MNNNKKTRLTVYTAVISIFLSMSIFTNSVAAETLLTTKKPVDTKAFMEKAKKIKAYPRCSNHPLPIQKENYQKKSMSLRGLTGIYVNIDDIIKGAESRKIYLSKDFKKTINDKFEVAGMTLLNEEEIKLIQGQPELSVFAAYPKHLGPFKEGQPVIKYNEDCCLASTWTSFSQGASILRDPNTNFKLSTWGEGHNTSDCSNLTQWYQDTIIKTIDNFISTKIKADTEYKKRKKLDKKTMISKPVLKVSKKSEKNTCDILTPEYLELFDIDESTISATKYRQIDKVINQLKKCSDLKFTVETHSDARSEIEYNKKLSIERADTIEKYLIKKGINPLRFSIEAFGKTKPLSKENTKAVHVSNKRVAIIPILD